MTTNIIDAGLNNWDPKYVSDNWTEKSAKIRGRDGERVKEGCYYQRKPRIYSVQIYKDTKDVYHYQNPIVGFATSVIYLTSALPLRSGLLRFMPSMRLLNLLPMDTTSPFRKITCYGNLIHALYHSANSAQNIWNNWGDTQFSIRQALSKPGVHFKHAIQDAVLVYATDSLYNSSPSLFGIHLVHALAVTAIFAYAAYNPLQTRVWANHRIARWDISPIPEAELAKMNWIQKIWHFLDGSYSLLHIFRMQRIGNEDTDKKRVEIL